MSKRTRQQAILEIVSKSIIPSQAVLATELKARGFEVTQATLSRDISDLNLLKSKDGYTLPGDTSGRSGPSLPDPHGTIKRSVSKVDNAANMVVIRTTTGGAQAVAAALDEGLYEGILGTIAGDDTILVVSKTEGDALAFKEQLDELLK